MRPNSKIYEQKGRKGTHSAVYCEVMLETLSLIREAGKVEHSGLRINR